MPEIRRPRATVFDDWTFGLKAARCLRCWMKRIGISLDQNLSDIEQLARIEAALSVSPRHVPRLVRVFLRCAKRDWIRILSRRGDDEAEHFSRLNELSWVESVAADFALRSLKNLPSWRARWEAGDRETISWQCFLLAGLRTHLMREVPTLRIRRLAAAHITALPSEANRDTGSSTASHAMSGNAGRIVLDWLNAQDLTIQRIVRLRAGLPPARHPWTMRAIAKSLGCTEREVQEVMLFVRDAAMAALRPLSRAS